MAESRRGLYFEEVLTRLSIAERNETNEKKLRDVVREAIKIEDRFDRVCWLRNLTFGNLTEKAEVIAMAFDNDDRIFAIYHLTKSEPDISGTMASLVGTFTRQLPPRDIWLESAKPVAE